MQRAELILAVWLGAMGSVMASLGEMDMGIEFGLMPRATATVAATGTNVQVRSSKLLVEEAEVQKEKEEKKKSAS